MKLSLHRINFKSIPPNYSVIDNYLSRSAQPDKSGFCWLKKQGVTDIINFRTMYADKIGFNEKDAVEKLGMKYHQIPTITKSPQPEKVEEFLDLVDNIKKSGGKGHIHCFAGADRTGLYAFIYKMKMGIGTLLQNQQEWISKGHNISLYPKLIPWATDFVKKYYPKLPPAF